MPTPSRPHGEHPNTYFVEERFSKEEYNRLMIQEQMVTKGMGGVLPEQPDSTIFGSVLDIACGPGIWLISAAQTYPNLTELIGIDINARLLANARQQREAVVGGFVEGCPSRSGPTQACRSTGHHDLRQALHHRAG